MENIYDPRVRYVVNECNIGMIGSVNKGINLFSEEVDWCTVLSDDDYLDKEFLKRLLHNISESAAKSIIHSHRIFVDEHGHIIREAAISPKEETAFDYMKMRACFKRETYLTGVLFNRKAFRDIKGYPAFITGLATDDALIFALSLKDRLVFEPNAYAYIRIHDKAESRFSFDGMRKLQTIKQFGEYCTRVAEESRSLDIKQLSDVENAVKKYVKALNSWWWVKTLHFVLDQESKDSDQIAELLSLFQVDPDNFSFRVAFAVTCHKFIGIFPEKSKNYRKLWESIIIASQFVRK
jgi:GT2 family glycosyltransferase